MKNNGKGFDGYLVLAATARSVIPKGSAAASAKAMADGLLKPRTMAGRALTLLSTSPGMDGR